MNVTMAARHTAAATSATNATHLDREMHIDLEAQKLIHRYNLSNLVCRVEDAILQQNATPIKVLRVSLTADREWSGDKPRVLITVEFDTDLPGAYEAWKQVYPLIEPVSAPAEDGETLTFEFAGRSG